MFEQLLIGTSFRGPHSSGVGMVEWQNGNHSHLSFMKIADHAYNLVADGKYQDWLKPKMIHAVAMIGHGRYATVGRVITSNAHPFMKGHILLAHNGGFNNHKELTKEDFDVDSEHAAWLIEKKGAEWALKNLHGGYALSWFDSKEHKLNLIRNYSKPIWIAKEKNRAFWYYASERELIEFVLKRNNVQYEQMFEPEEGMLVQWSPEENDDKLHLKKMELFSWPQQQQHYPVHRGRHHLDEDDEWEPWDDRFPRGEAVYSETQVPILGPHNYRALPQHFLSPSQRQPNKNELEIQEGRKYLAEWGLDLGDLVSVYVCDFARYSNTTVFGRAFGYFTEQDCPTNEIWINGIDPHKFSEIEEGTNEIKFKDDNYLAIISAMKKVGDKWIILLNSLTKEDDLPDTVEIAVPFNVKDAEKVKATEAKKQAKKEKKKQLKGHKKAEDIQMVQGPNNQFIAVQEFNELTKRGCSGCTKDLHAKDHKNVYWKNRDTPLCFDCAVEHAITKPSHPTVISLPKRDRSTGEIIKSNEDKVREALGMASNNPPTDPNRVH